MLYREAQSSEIVGISVIEPALQRLNEIRVALNMGSVKWNSVFGKLACSSRIPKLFSSKGYKHMKCYAL